MNISLAHVSPVSPVSVGTMPSNKTLRPGVIHVDRSKASSVRILGQCPSADDPLTGTISGVVYMYHTGVAGKKITPK